MDTKEDMATEEDIKRLLTLTQHIGVITKNIK